MMTWDRLIVCCLNATSSKNYMATAGKLELIIKISELPDVKAVENGWQYFELARFGAFRCTIDTRFEK